MTFSCYRYGDEWMVSVDEDGCVLWVGVDGRPEVLADLPEWPSKKEMSRLLGATLVGGAAA